MEFYRFIDLDRRFLDVAETDDAENAAVQSYLNELFGIGEQLDWKELLKSRIVVILGEAGSGKTWEFRHRVEVLREQGNIAFYLPLERLVGSALRDSLASVDLDLFDKWMNGSDQAIFFLDSVDESKLRKQKDFEFAFENFIRGIGISNRHRIRVVISSRITEWRWHADRDIVLSPMRSFTSKERDNKQDVPSDFRIVKLMPLDRKRVLKFVEDIGIQQPQRFIDALDTHHAWEFVRRPIDVVDLINYWHRYGKLGTLTELIEFNVSTKLKETTERSQSDPLTPEKARLGVECLAAATVFCRSLNFYVPDTVPLGDKALVAADCLPADWTSDMYRAILTRPIFDAASYGRIRFHHRRVAEYLTACWVDRCMRESLPYPVLEDLLFDQRNDRWYIRPSLRPVTAWLASGRECWSERIRNKILSCAPELFLEYGDAEVLSVDYKRQLLHELIRLYKGRKRAFLDADPEALSRLAAPGLTPDISAMILDTDTPYDIRAILLRMIGLGRLRDCLDTALQICASPSEAERLKWYAVVAIRDAGGQEELQALARIAQGYDTIGDDLCIFLCEALFPRAINAREMTDLLRKAKNVRLHSLQWRLKIHLDAETPAGQCADLLCALIDLAQERPRRNCHNKEVPISVQFSWLGEVIAVVLINLLKHCPLKEHDIELAARTLLFLEYYQEYDRLDQKQLDEINKHLNLHPAIRRAYVWSSIEEKRHIRHPSLFWLYSPYKIVQLREADLDWLIHDIQEADSQEKRETALKLAIDLWYRLGSKRLVLVKIRKVSYNNAQLIKLFQEKAHYGVYRRIRAFFYRQRYSRWIDAPRYLRQKINQCLLSFRQRIRLWCNLNKLRNGSETCILYKLAREVNNSQRLGVYSWKPLISKKGARIACAAAEGWKVSWRRFEPLLPHEKPDPSKLDARVIVGLCGLDVSWTDGDLKFNKITAEEAKIACRYAVNELTDFPDWFPDIVKYQPDAVCSILLECINGEWLIPTSQIHYYEVLSKLRYNNLDISPIAPIIEEAILEKLRNSDPLNYEILEAALFILLSSQKPPSSDLADLAAKRTPASVDDNQRFLLWMIVWLQLDAIPALQYLEKVLIEAADPMDLMIRICVGLSGESHGRYPLIKNSDYLSIECLRKFIPLVYSYICVENDTDRSNCDVLRPTARDTAQIFCNGLFERLARISRVEVNDILQSFAEDPMFARQRDWILDLSEQRTEASTELTSWQPNDIRKFMKEYEIFPHSDYDLFRITCNILITIKDNVERGEISPRSDLHSDDSELKLRRWLARQLRAKANGRFNVVQEEEIDSGRPDLRIKAPGIRPVSIEVKWADNWKLENLRDGLQNQLVGKYLRSRDSNYGIYILGKKPKAKKGEDYWIDTENEKKLLFNELIEYMSVFAKKILKYSDIDGLKVFGINFE